MLSTGEGEQAGARAEAHGSTGVRERAAGPFWAARWGASCLSPPLASPAGFGTKWKF